MGIRFLSDWPEWRSHLGAGDVVILPAFGVDVGTLGELEVTGCTLVDTTCGSVLNVWKNVRRYAQDGFTSVIHGKVHHEETQGDGIAGCRRARRPLSRALRPGPGRRGVRFHP